MIDFKSGKNSLFWLLHILIEVAYGTYWAMKIENTYKLSTTCIHIVCSSLGS